MSSSLNHYTANVQVTDAVMHNKTPLATSTFVIAVLAANVTDAQALIQEFYGRSGMSSKMINGVHTLFRSAAPNVPGAIRTVSVTNITLVPDTVPVVGATPAPATSTATETTTAVPSVINATASPAATTAVTDTTTTTQQEVSAPTLKPGGRGRKTLTVDPSASTQTAAPVVAETTSSTTSAPTSSATAPAAS